MYYTEYLTNSFPGTPTLCETSWFDPEGDCINEIFGLPLTGPVPFIIAGGIVVAIGAIIRAFNKKE